MGIIGMFNDFQCMAIECVIENAMARTGGTNECFNPSPAARRQVCTLLTATLSLCNLATQLTPETPSGEDCLTWNMFFLSLRSSKHS
jgi:hypothetical protein